MILLIDYMWTLLVSLKGLTWLPIRVKDMSEGSVTVLSPLP